MTFGEMLQYTNRLNEILSSNIPKHVKSSRLNTLLNDIKKAYNIPVFYNEEFERQNPFVMQLYRTVSAELGVYPGVSHIVAL
jgi:hypothetical protein